jgi:hypothetical protein
MGELRDEPEAQELREDAAASREPQALRPEGAIVVIEAPPLPDSERLRA